jgi:response regulator RpfG family c-di-GMP phosphodiesterase
VLQQLNKIPTVLVVDDEELQLKLVNARLELEGYKVISTRSGKKAVEIVKTEKPEMVILDMYLQDANGYEITKQIHKINKAIPIIAVSGAFTEENIVQLLEQGVVDCIQKPIYLSQLCLKIRNNINVVRTSYDTQRQKQLLNSILDMIHEMNKDLKLENTIDELFKSMKDLIKCDRIGVALFNKATGDMVQRYTVSNYPNIILDKGYSEPLHDTTLEITYLTRQPRVLNNLEIYFENKPESATTKMLLEEGIRSNITLPIVVNEICLGFVFFSSKEINAYNLDDSNFFNIASNHIAMAISKTVLVENLIIASVQGLAEMAERRDKETGQHMNRIAEYCTVLGKQLIKNKHPNIDQDFLEQIYLTSPLHDVGKVMVPDAILRKPMKLTSEEFEIIKQHSPDGKDILQSIASRIDHPGINFFDMAMKIAGGHHEKYDGTGYPKGLSGKDIPICARIVAVADVFDALMSKRYYKDQIPFEETVNILNNGSGSHFDPVLIDAFNQCKESFMKIWERMQ